MAASTVESLRAFIAIALEPGLTDELSRVQRQLGAGLCQGTIRWVKPDQLHLTLKFLGGVAKENVDELAAALDRACNGIAPFRLGFAGAGCFPHTKNPRVVWLGINGEVDALQRLQARIAQETQTFGNHTEERAFQPHLTIGRIKTGGPEARKAGERVARAVVPELGDWPVRQVHLMQSELASQGPRYTSLATSALRA